MTDTIITEYGAMREYVKEGVEPSVWYDKMDVDGRQAQHLVDKLNSPDYANIIKKAYLVKRTVTITEWENA